MGFLLSEEQEKQFLSLINPAVASPLFAYRCRRAQLLPKPRLRWGPLVLHQGPWRLRPKTDVLHRTVQRCRPQSLTPNLLGLYFKYWYIFSPCILFVYVLSYAFFLNQNHMDFNLFVFVNIYKLSRLYRHALICLIQFDLISAFFFYILFLAVCLQQFLSLGVKLFDKMWIELFVTFRHECNLAALW